MVGGLVYRSDAPGFARCQKQRGPVRSQVAIAYPGRNNDNPGDHIYIYIYLLIYTNTVRKSHTFFTSTFPKDHSSFFKSHMDLIVIHISSRREVELQV